MTMFSRYNTAEPLELSDVSDDCYLQIKVDRGAVRVLVSDGSGFGKIGIVDLSPVDAARLSMFALQAGADIAIAAQSEVPFVHPDDEPDEPDDDDDFDRSAVKRWGWIEVDGWKVYPNGDGASLNVTTPTGHLHRGVNMSGVVHQSYPSNVRSACNRMFATMDGAA